jgi:hypothetical protein
LVPDSSDDEAEDNDELPSDGDSDDDDSGCGNDQANDLGNHLHYLQLNVTVCVIEGISITDSEGNPKFITALADLLADDPKSRHLQFTQAAAPPPPSVSNSEKRVFVVGVPLVCLTSSIVSSIYMFETQLITACYKPLEFTNLVANSPEVCN